MRKLANVKIKSKEEIFIQLKDAKKIASMLDSIVVSLDRIGSTIAIYKLSTKIEREIIYDYYADFKPSQNLAEARRIVFEALDKVFPGKFENGIKGTKYWEGKTAYKKYLNNKKKQLENK